MSFDFLSAAALAVVISLGSVGLPGQVSFMATNLPVTQPIGLPTPPLGLLLAVDTIPDVFATTGNVTGDLTAASLVARREDEAPDSLTMQAALVSNFAPAYSILGQSQFSWHGVARTFTSADAPVKVGRAQQA